MAKPKKTQPAATAPRVDVFDAKGKPKTVDASALRIAFADGRSLLVSLPDTADGAITLVAEHADAATHAMLALRPEHHDSITLRIEAEPAAEAEDADDALAGAEMLTLDLTVQHGDALKAAARKALPKAGRTSKRGSRPRCSPMRSSTCASSTRKKAARSTTPIAARTTPPTC